VDYRIESIVDGDTPNAISTSIALTSLKFADFWQIHQHDFDLVFCLGDRFEMFAAVLSGIPYNIKFAHLHGGEKTLGAIDNIFRHAITLASKYHFVSCEEHADRVRKLIESGENVYNVGALGLDNLKTKKLFNRSDFLQKFNIDLKKPTILVTLHPETVETEKNHLYVDVLSEVLLEVKKYQVLITLPNADTSNSIIRNRLLSLSEESENRITCFENLGSAGYFTAMKHCVFLLGNTSSGIIEAASFGKWVINLGNRQKGRIQSQNILNVPFSKDEILKSIMKIEKKSRFQGKNVYFKKNSARKICTIIRQIL
jgi:GDP/UDP-N,N'-diacetylbacillosamine 2-epimerase (hydrolysing)